MAKKKQKKQSGGGQQFLTPERYLRERARTLEIGTCYVMKDIDEAKEGHVIVTRRHTGGRVSVAFYLVDMACLGVKDSFYKMRMEDWEFDEYIDEHRDMFRECSYEEAHNRVWGSIAYAEEAGIKPDKSFQLTQYMLEEDTDDVPLIDYEYGKDGKHFLVCHSELEASRYLPLLRKNLGEGNFEYLIGDPDFDDEEDDSEELTTLHDLPVDHLSMVDIVNAKPVTAILFLSKMMGLNYKDTEDEAELRSKWMDYILEHPEELLIRLPKNETDLLLLILADPDKAKGVPTANRELSLFLEMAGVADVYWNENDEYCILVADDFLKVALPLVEDISRNDDVRERHDVEGVIEGMANLYGEVTLEDAKRAVMIDRGGLRSEAGQLIDKVMDHSLLLGTTIHVIDDTKKRPFDMADDNLAFCTRYYLGQSDDLLKAIGKQPPMPTQPFTDDDARRFTADEVRKASSNDGVPTIPNEQQKKFWKFLTQELEWDDYYARRTCLELWVKANKADIPSNDEEITIEEYFDYEALGYDSVPEETRQKGHRLLAEYVAHIPRWTLKGHAPAKT